MRKDQRFGSAKRDKPFKCYACEKEFPPGEQRWVDNTEYPRRPYCTTCKKQMETIAPPPEPKDIKEAIRDGIKEGIACMLNEIAAIHGFLHTTTPTEHQLSEARKAWVEVKKQEKQVKFADEYPVDSEVM